MMLVLIRFLVISLRDTLITIDANDINPITYFQYTLYIITIVKVNLTKTIEHLLLFSI